MQCIRMRTARSARVLERAERSGCHLAVQQLGSRASGEDNVFPLDQIILLPLDLGGIHTPTAAHMREGVDNVRCFEYIIRPRADRDSTRLKANDTPEE